MRLPEPDAANLTEAQQALKEAVTAGRKGLGDDVWKRGPFGVWQHAPHIGSEALGVGGAIRFGSDLPDDVREVAICTTGAFFHSKFEFAAHKAIAVSVGVDGDALDRLAAGEDPGWDGDLAAAHRFAETMLRDHRVPDEQYADAIERFGEQGVVEMVSAVGYYSLISLTLNTFQVPLGDGMDDPFPDVAP